MIHELFSKINTTIEIETAKAHCDVPCGIYDPIVAQINALTVVRMVDLMRGLAEKDPVKGAEFYNSMSRYVSVKEEHAEKAKHEVRVIWGDYIKPAHLEKHPELHELVHNIMQLGSASRQTADRVTAVNFVEAVNKFAEIFWETKGIATKRAEAPYAPALEMVYPDL